MAAPPSFPAPPDLSELLKFFTSPSYDHMHAARVQQHPSTAQRNRVGPDAEHNKPLHLRHSSSASTAPSQRQRPHGNRISTQEYRNRAKPSSESARTQPTTTSTATAQRRRGSPPKEPTPSVASDWNSSTQIPATTAKPLKHQILDRTYMPPAPVVVDASGATHLVKRLSRTTISSRLKRHQADDDEAAALAAASAALAGAFERRSRHYQTQKNTSKGTRLQGEEDDEMASSSATVSSPPDSRARDGIQTLLMYRREVENRLSMDPTHFPAQVATGNLH